VVRNNIKILLFMNSDTEVNDKSQSFDIVKDDGSQFLLLFELKK